METALTLTKQLQRYYGGDKGIAETLFSALLPKLREVAAGTLRRERYVMPYSPSELINEAWIKSLGSGRFQIRNRAHYFAIAGKVMRQVLVEAARNRLAQRRGPDAVISSLEGVAPSRLPGAVNDAQMVEIDLLISKLEKKNAVVAHIVELHYLCELSLAEIAEIHGVEVWKVRRLWEKGRDWLKRGLHC